MESFQGTQLDDSEITMRYSNRVKTIVFALLKTSIGKAMVTFLPHEAMGYFHGREGSPRQTDKSAMGEKDAIDKGRI